VFQEKESWKKKTTTDWGKEEKFFKTMVDNLQQKAHTTSEGFFISMQHGLYVGHDTFRNLQASRIYSFIK
jgi:hypothetical protein